MKKSRTGWLGIFSDALATFTLAPGRPPMPMPEPRYKPATPEENARRDAEALANDWRKVGQDIWNAADVVMAGKK